MSEGGDAERQAFLGGGSASSSAPELLWRDDKTGRLGEM